MNDYPDGFMWAAFTVCFVICVLVVLHEVFP